MPCSFSRLFLGKKAITVDEDALPCRPREVVPLAADSPVATKPNFDLTEIGLALRQKLHLNTATPVPAGHGPLAIAADDQFSTYSRKLKAPATFGLAPSLTSLPHIPDISSTLGRDIHEATQDPLLAGAGKANLKVANSKIYTTACPKRRTRSSSVLGNADLPRPWCESHIETLGGQRQDTHHVSSAMFSSPYDQAPVELPLIFAASSFACSTSSVHERIIRPQFSPRVHACQRDIQSSSPYTGHPAAYIVHAVPQRHWYVQQYVEAKVNWSMPLMPASDALTPPIELLPAMPNLDLSVRQSPPALSTYLPFPPTCQAVSQADISEPLSAAPYGSN